MNLLRCLLFCLLCSLVNSIGAEEIVLNQATNLSISATADSQQAAIDIAGRIWLLQPGDTVTRPLTDKRHLNQRPAISPDGRFVAYESLRNGHRQIFVTDLSDDSERQITFGPFEHRSPAWRPGEDHGRELTFSTNRGGNFNLWHVDLESLAIQQLTFAAEHDRDPAWDSRGKRLTYVASDQEGSAIMSLEPGASPQLLLREPARLYGPAWRPGGGLLTYIRQTQGESQLRMLLLSEPVITKAVTKREQVFPYSAHWVNRNELMYAADGYIRQRELGAHTFQNIPFTVTVELERSPRKSRAQANVTQTNRPALGIAGETAARDGHVVIAALGDLWEISRADDAEPELVRQLTNDVYVDTDPAFSPNGRRLAYVSDRTGSPQVWIMDMATAAARQLTQETGPVRKPVWSRSGREIAYLVAEPEQPDDYLLRTIDATAGFIRTLPLVISRPGQPVETQNGWSVEPEPATAALKTPLTWRPAVQTGRLVIRAGQVFDGIGPDYLLRQDIVIEQGQIVAIRPWQEPEPESQFIDASNETVIPGLMDLSVHTDFADMERTGRKWLAAGVTTIRQSTGQPQQLMERLESWHSGKRAGPNLQLSIKLCFDNELGSPLQQAKAWLELAREFSLASFELCEQIAAEQQKQIIASAHEQGLSVIVPDPIPGLLLGADELRLTANSSPLSQDFLMVSGKAGATMTSRLTSTLGSSPRVMQTLMTGWQFSNLSSPADRMRYQDFWNGVSEASKGRTSNAPNPNTLLGLGGQLVIGSDAPYTPHGLGTQAELRLLAKRGIQPFQILKMASFDSARVLGRAQTTGLLREGFAADLVIIDGDPLKDIEAMSRVTGTVVGGRYFSRQMLSTKGQRGLPSVEKLYTLQQP